MYVNIFDGFLVKKSRYNRIKLELNMVLKRDVGYMFYMKQVEGKLKLCGYW